MLTEVQINALADKVNAKIDLPIVGERLERMLIKFGLNKLNAKLAEVLPPEMSQMLDDAADGLSDEEVQLIEEKVVTYLNEKINIPILNEDSERKLIETVVEELISALKKGKTLSD
jgi:translation elongation factor EF-1beta